MIDPSAKDVGQAVVVGGILNLAGAYLKAACWCRDEAIPLILIGGSAVGHALVLPDWRGGLVQGAVVAFGAISAHQLKRQSAALLRGPEPKETKPPTS